MDAEMRRCPYCAEEIRKEAIKCKHCGEFLDFEIRSARFHNSQQDVRLYPKWSRGTAALLSLLLPGAGQMYKGNLGVGLLWMLFVAIGYAMLIVPGLILHLICIITASSGDPYK